MSSFYEYDANPEQLQVMEHFRDKISESGLGVSLVGNRLTVRGDIEGQLCDMHMLISDMTTVDESRKSKEIQNQTQHYLDSMTKKESEKYWDHKAEIFYIKEGYYPQ